MWLKSLRFLQKYSRSGTTSKVCTNEKEKSILLARTHLPVNASPWIPLEVISGLRFWKSDRFPRFLKVENPPNPSSKMPSWNPREPLRLGSNKPLWCSPIPNQDRFILNSYINIFMMMLVLNRANVLSSSSC